MNRKFNKEPNREVEEEMKKDMKDVNNVTVTIYDKQYVLKKGTTYGEVSDKYTDRFKTPIILAKVNHRLRELNKTIEQDETIEFIDMISSDGYRTYQRSISFLLVVACRNLYRHSSVVVQYSLGNGYYVEISNSNFDIDDIEKEMNRLAKENFPIEKVVVRTDTAMDIFKEQKMEDKYDLLKYRRASNINLYKLDGFYDYYYGYMILRTKDLKDKFKLHKYGDGLIIQFLDRNNPTVTAKFEPTAKLFDTLKESTNWGLKVGVDNVAQLNNKIAAGEFDSLMLLQEAYMEKKIGIVADQIIANDKNRFVFISGPSSSGKTTFSKRLAVQLAAHGINPKPVSLDDYYVNREDTPLDENGNYDYECLEAIDVPKFKENMTTLLSGGEIDVPKFNFVKGKRMYDGTKMKIEDSDVLIIEGLHGLNPKLSQGIPDENKFTIYISALTALNVDDHNRIPTTDARLLRRIVRDSRERDKTAKETIAMWDKVREGEDKYIFPYQEDADIVFNSSLIYELSILKQFVEPLLFNVDRDCKEYKEAKRLVKFLGYFLGITSENVPATSLLREFIGGSYFYQ